MFAGTLRNDCWWLPLQSLGVSVVQHKAGPVSARLWNVMRSRGQHCDTRHHLHSSLSSFAVLNFYWKDVNVFSSLADKCLLSVKQHSLHFFFFFLSLSPHQAFLLSDLSSNHALSAWVNVITGKLSVLQWSHACSLCAFVKVSMWLRFPFFSFY